jgi:hypothetical protein
VNKARRAWPQDLGDRIVGEQLAVAPGYAGEADVGEDLAAGLLEVRKAFITPALARECGFTDVDRCHQSPHEKGTRPGTWGSLDRHTCRRSRGADRQQPAPRFPA